MNHFAVYLKLTQHCKPTILQLKNKLLKQERFQTVLKFPSPVFLLMILPPNSMWK